MSGPGAAVNPYDIRNIKLKKAVRGYDTDAVDRLVSELSANLQSLEAERQRLEGQVLGLERELQEHRNVQHLMSDALLSAQRAADELKGRTEEECEALREQARVEARAIVERSQNERDQAASDLERLKTQEQELRASYRVLLAAALDRLDERQDGEPSSTTTASLLDALAPRRTTSPETAPHES